MFLWKQTCIVIQNIHKFWIYEKLVFVFFWNKINKNIRILKIQSKSRILKIIVLFALCSHLINSIESIHVLGDMAESTQ